MPDSQQAIIRPSDGGNDACVVMECVRCERRVYTYAESPEIPITMADLPLFCRHCGKALEPWTLEYHREWYPSEEVKINVRSEDE